MLCFVIGVGSLSRGVNGEATTASGIMSQLYCTSPIATLSASAAAAAVASRAGAVQ